MDIWEYLLTMLKQGDILNLTTIPAFTNIQPVLQWIRKYCLSQVGADLFKKIEYYAMTLRY
jgi:hypothetical protein